jgi:hypothetical protein
VHPPNEAPKGNGLIEGPEGIENRTARPLHDKPSADGRGRAEAIEDRDPVATIGKQGRQRQPADPGAYQTNVELVH